MKSWLIQFVFVFVIMLVARLLGNASDVFGSIVITFITALVMVAAMKWLEGRGL